MQLLTRSDFDGICCAVLLKELGLMDEMAYAHRTATIEMMEVCRL
ncbi:MAG TPA: hypothetical protein VFF53_05125 [Geobacteraceae bacterium]|nr:hypothetical protein [Geobacteraceae bacterium]